MMAQLFSWIPIAVLGAVVAVLPGGRVTAAASPGPQSPDTDSPSVEAGRRALREAARFPWYDRDHDQLKRIDVEAPAKPKSPGSWVAKPRPAGNWWRLPAIGNVLRVIAWLILAGLLAVGIVYVVRAYLRKLSAGAKPSSPVAQESSAHRLESLPFPLKRPQSDLLSEAGRYYAIGDFNEAIIYLFSYELVELDKGNLICLEKGKTNRQYLRELGALPALGALLQDTMHAFEDVFFGEHLLQRARFESIWSQLDGFHDLIQRATVAG
jgi:hypothetical protein